MEKTFETEHFFVEHHPNLTAPYSIQPKPHTQAESDQHHYSLSHVGGFAAGRTAGELLRTVFNSLVIWSCLARMSRSEALAASICCCAAFASLVAPSL
jgi:hypothetical protein